MTSPTTLGTLVLAATPIGHPRDASPRLRDELARADVLAAEDTRRLRRLAADLEVGRGAGTLSYHEHNEASRTRELVDRLLEGDRVVLVTDAGMPSVSDPGYRLVSAAIRVGVTVTWSPGRARCSWRSPSPVCRWTGSASRGSSRASRGSGPARWRSCARNAGPWCSSRRRTDWPMMLAAMAEAFGPDRAAAVCRELTKTYEEVRRGTLAELTAWAEEHARGEITVVVAGLRGAATEVADVVPTILERVAAGERLKDVCADLALQTGLSKKALYDAALAAR